MTTDASAITCKGTLFLSVRMFTERHYGAAAVEKLLADLEPAERQQLVSTVAVGMYPLGPVFRYHRALDRRFGKGDLAMCTEVGRFAAEWQLNTFHKFLLRFASPVWMYERGSRVWSGYFNAGRWELSQPEPKQILARLHDFEYIDEAFCRRELGWYRRAAELTGVKDVHLEERACRAKGDAFCEYFGSWS